jgi:hypothetical protein
MAVCLISEHCLFEKAILLNNIRVVIHYLPFHPVIEVSLEYSCGFGVVLFCGKFEYKSKAAYDSFLAYVFGDEDDEESLLPL